MVKYSLWIAACFVLHGCAVTDCRPGINPSSGFVDGMTNGDLAAWQTLATFGPFLMCKVQ